uniref:Candidate secreted effector n=1 Tax=Meloidogyne incognita TaxID=6306 RepID=A0A914NW08_MELIC
MCENISFIKSCLICGPVLITSIVETTKIIAKLILIFFLSPILIIFIWQPLAFFIDIILLMVIILVMVIIIFIIVWAKIWVNLFVAPVIIRICIYLTYFINFR